MFVKHIWSTNFSLKSLPVRQRRWAIMHVCRGMKKGSNTKRAWIRTTKITYFCCWIYLHMETYFVSNRWMNTSTSRGSLASFVASWSRVAPLDDANQGSFIFFNIDCYKSIHVQRLYIHSLALHMRLIYLLSNMKSSAKFHSLFRDRGNWNHRRRELATSIGLLYD